MIIKGSANAND